MTDSGQLQPEETLDDPFTDGPLGRDLHIGPEGIPAEEDSDPADTLAGASRSGRLVASDLGVDPDTEAELVARDVGIDGGAAGAEETAVHEVAEVAEPPD